MVQKVHMDPPYHFQSNPWRWIFGSFWTFCLLSEQCAAAERWWTDGRRSDCSSLLEGIEEIFSGRTQVTSTCWLLQADAATLRRGGGGALLLPPSPRLMEIISPISAGRCQNGKIMSSSRATTLLELSGCRYSKMEFSKGKSEGLKKRKKKSW